jgi:hypothetical protein
MFREGRALLAAGKIAEACAVFESSQKLDPATSTLMNLASCRERNGQLATAWGVFLDAARATRDARDDATRNLHQVALDRAKRIEPRISKLTIQVPAGSRIDGLEILRGADKIEPAMWNRALPVDGGSYQITVRAPGATPRTLAVTIGVELDARTVDIPRLERAPAPAIADAADAADARPSSPDAGRPAPSSPRRLPLAFAGGGALLLGGAIGFGVWGSSTYRAARDEQMDQARRDSLYHDANTRRHVALGMAAAGVACGGVAAWLYFTGRGVERGATATTAWVHVAPVVDLGGAGAGLVIAGGF